MEIHHTFTIALFGQLHLIGKVIAPRARDTKAKLFKLQPIVFHFKDNFHPHFNDINF